MRDSGKRNGECMIQGWSGKNGDREGQRREGWTKGEPPPHNVWEGKISAFNQGQRLSTQGIARGVGHGASAYRGRDCVQRNAVKVTAKKEDGGGRRENMGGWCSGVPGRIECVILKGAAGEHWRK